MNNFDNTYHSDNGKYQAFLDILTKLIPSYGPVPDPKGCNKALEKLRIACNCYHDLYNNGLCNRAVEFRKVMGFSAFNELKFNHGNYSDALVRATENAIDQIILDAAVEQLNLRVYKGV